jgi:hypothetical protein
MVDIFLTFRLMRWFREAAYKELRTDTGDAMIFRVSRPARYLYRFWIVLVGVFAVLTFFVGGIEWYLRAAYIPFFLLACTQWPWAVVLTRDGISKRSCLSLRKTIRRTDVTALAYDSTSRRFTVVGKHGQTIRCSPYLVSPATFCHEMYKHAAALGPMPTRSSFESGEVVL